MQSQAGTSQRTRELQEKYIFIKGYEKEVMKYVPLCKAKEGKKRIGLMQNVQMQRRKKKEIFEETEKI